MHVMHTGCEGTDALASSADWEEIVAECESKLNEMSSAFEDCKTFEGISTQGLSWKTDLESNSKQKRSELNDQISKAIERLEFEQLRSYLDRSPSAGPAHVFYMDAVSLVTRIEATSKRQIVSDCNRSSKKYRLQKGRQKPILWTLDPYVPCGYHSVSTRCNKVEVPQNALRLRGCDSESLRVL